jgi:uncharacterized protein (DUF1778 family)
MATSTRRMSTRGTSTRGTSTRDKKLADRELKRERIELRVAASAKQLIKRAMAVSGLTAGDLAYEGARRVLDEHGRMVLTGEDRDAFLDALADPPEPTAKFVAALKRHRRHFG